MPRGVKKEHLPQKICEQCERPFTWRKKWEDCWDEVHCCSKSCKAKRRARRQEENRAAAAAGAAGSGEFTRALAPAAGAGASGTAGAPEE